MYMEPDLLCEPVCVTIHKDVWHGFGPTWITVWLAGVHGHHILLCFVPLIILLLQCKQINTNIFFPTGKNAQLTTSYLGFPSKVFYVYFNMLKLNRLESCGIPPPALHPGLFQTCVKCARHKVPDGGLKSLCLLYIIVFNIFASELLRCKTAAM